MIKPDGVFRGLDQAVFDRVTQSGLKIIDQKKIALTSEQAEKLYRPHLGKPFYAGLIKFITSGPVIVTIISGNNAIKKLRDLMGATDPRKAVAGTIRGDLAEENVLTADKTIKNIVHGSDSPESAKREMAIFFKEGK
ncbi:MAG: nucleoside-diphosphate kinase [Candidatus Saganbacteria bacterium]|nr:nucleoside-diphosphate kinase [Candidatus Saganbacteria bacterium]